MTPDLTALKVTKETALLLAADKMASFDIETEEKDTPYLDLLKVALRSLASNGYALVLKKPTQPPEI